MTKNKMIKGLLIFGLLTGCTAATIDNTGVATLPSPQVTLHPSPTPAPSLSPTATANPTASPSPSPVDAKADALIDLKKIHDGVLDLDIPSLNESCLLAVNKSGDANGSAEAVGILPANGSVAPASYRMPTEPRIKDLSSISSRASRSRRIMAIERVTNATLAHTFYCEDSPKANKQIPTTRVYGGPNTKCLIFLEADSNLSVDWNAVGRNFDENIYPKMIEAYGSPTDVDENGQIVICYYSFKEQNTMGYFFPGDLEQPSADLPDAQGMEVFFLNSTWGAPDCPEMKKTLAHEFQHMINFGQRILVKRLPQMDTWINEGLAEAAEQLVTGIADPSRLNTLATSDAIRDGKALCSWEGNNEDYALAYTFIEYCKNQSSEKAGIFKQLLEHPLGDCRAIVDVLKYDFSSFAQLNIAYRLANLIHGEGILGYGEENALFTAGNPRSPASIQNLVLAPGGALYLRPLSENLKAFQASGAGSNVLFVRVNKDRP